MKFLIYLFASVLSVGLDALAALGFYIAGRILLPHFGAEPVPYMPIFWATSG